MSATAAAPSPRWIWISALGYSLVVLGIGLWMSLATGEWVALLCASALVVLPVAGVAARSRWPRQAA